MNQPLTAADVRLIKSRIDKAYFSLARIYGPFLLGLILAYQYAKGRKAMKNISESQYNTIYIIVFSFFAIVFAFFCYRDYKKNVVPYKKEMAAREKSISTFVARKYFDPIFKNYLLYHPTKENKYIQLTEEEYNAIADGQEMELHSGVNTGIILGITINGEIKDDVEEFSFS